MSKMMNVYYLIFYVLYIKLLVKIIKFILQLDNVPQKIIPVRIVRETFYESQYAFHASFVDYDDLL